MGATAAPSVAERIGGIEQRLGAFGDDHAKALKTLAGADDLGKGIEAFRQQAEKLKAGIKDTRGGKDLAAEARELTTELMKQVPGGSLDAKTAEQLDREALATARRAEALDGRISAIVKALDQSLSLIPQWTATFKAFSFDPKRQDAIVRKLISQRLAELQGATKAAEQLATEEASPKNNPPVRKQDAKALPPVEELSPALARALDLPGNEQAQARLNASCFELLHSRGAKILQPSTVPRFSPAEIADLLSAAKAKAPAALQLLGMMDITGRGHGLNAPRGVGYFKEAEKSLAKHPGLPFGPGVEKSAEPGAISGVGTVPFWLAECYLVGAMERDLGKACVYYALAVHQGDGRAAQRIRQLADLGLITTDDASRWTRPPTTPFFRGVLGLVEFQKVSLTSLYAQELRERPLPRRSISDDAPPPVPPRAGGRAYFGIDMAPAPRGLAGVVVEEVVRGSPAELAELRPRDLITAFDGSPVADSDDLRAALDKARPGQQITISGRHYHNGSFELPLTLGTVRPLTRSIECVEELIPVAPRLNPRRLGLRINTVVRGSHPDVAGLRSGDVVVAVAGEPVNQFGQLESALQGGRGGILKLTVWHPGQGLDAAPAQVLIPLGY